MVSGFVFSVAVAMAADKDVPDIETAIHRSVISLSQITRDFLRKEIELSRICRIAVLLKKSGVDSDNILFHKLVKKCTDMQRSDGGWTDVIETMWCATLLNIYSEFSDYVEKALKWLRNQSCNDGGWGKSIRDCGRIPVTGLLLYLLPQLSSDENLKWLENKWRQEQKREPCLTYKAAFAMMAFNKNNYQPGNYDLISKTICWLIDHQNDDGGWGPWKGHPVGSDPWCTGISIVGLLQYPDKIPKISLEKAIKWLIKNQLPNGLWSYHYIEEGSSWALHALVIGYSFLRREN